nr:wax ester/triacylglycerol synthase family O-acyltransferase [Acidobacteriota bacterium]
MKPLSGLDAAFLYLESERAPMHVGGVCIVDGQTPDGPLTFEIYRKMLSERLHVSDIFRRRLVELPLNLGHP